MSICKCINIYIYIDIDVYVLYMYVYIYIPGRSRKGCQLVGTPWKVLVYFVLRFAIHTIGRFGNPAAKPVTLPPIIMENRAIEDEFSFQNGHFLLP